MIEDLSESIREILAVEQRWAMAHLDLDLDTIAKILSENYRQIQPEGTSIPIP